MAFSIVMPALEMAQETGKLLAWRKKEGDRVAKGEPLLEIETDKAVVEVEAPADGVLAGIKAMEGAEIPVGQTIAWIVAPGETPPEAQDTDSAGARAESHRKSATSPVDVGADVAAIGNSGQASSAKISPKARRLAKELGVDVGSLRGSGPGGEVLASDVQGAVQAVAANAPVDVGTAALGRPGGPEVSDRGAVPATKLEVPSTVGRIMAERTTQSWKTVPHFFVSRDVDASALNEYRERVTNAGELKGIRLTHTDLLVALAARVLRKHRRLNASWSAEGIRFHDHVNMGIAIAVEDGVVAAVIRNADSASMAEITQRRIELADRARAGKLQPEDIADATFTISNLGMYGVDRFIAIITPPQAAILAVGSIVDRVVAIDSKLAIRPMMSLTLSCDHRVVDGARAAMFLRDLSDAISNPGHPE